MEMTALRLTEGRHGTALRFQFHHLFKGIAGHAEGLCIKAQEVNLHDQTVCALELEWKTFQGELLVLELLFVHVPLYHHNQPPHSTSSWTHRKELHLLTALTLSRSLWRAEFVLKDNIWLSTNHLRGGHWFSSTQRVTAECWTRTLAGPCPSPAPEPKMNCWLVVCHISAPHPCFRSALLLVQSHHCPPLVNDRITHLIT